MGQNPRAEMLLVVMSVLFCVALPFTLWYLQKAEQREPRSPVESGVGDLLC